MAKQIVEENSAASGNYIGTEIKQESEIKTMLHLVSIIWSINKNSKSYKPKLRLSI